MQCLWVNLFLAVLVLLQLCSFTSTAETTAAAVTGAANDDQLSQEDAYGDDEYGDDDFVSLSPSRQPSVNPVSSTPTTLAPIVAADDDDVDENDAYNDDAYTDDATRSPTLLPSAKPSSSIPTGTPTTIPSPLPTIAPTGPPTLPPSAMPTPIPSEAPSLAIGETFVPTTGAPSFAPSSYYTAILSQWASKTEQLIEERQAQHQSKYSSVTYTADYVQLDVLGRQLLGGCVDWHTTADEVETAIIGFSGAFVELVVLRSSSVSTDIAFDAPTVVTCNDTALVSSMTAVLSNGSAAVTSPLRVSCSGNDWVFKTCSASAFTPSAASLCINCTDPCSPSEQCTNAAQNNGYYMNPACVGVDSNSTDYNCSSGTYTYGTDSGLALLFLGFTAKDAAPSVVSISGVQSRTGLVLTVQLSKAGTARCAVYSSASEAAPVSLAALALQGFYAATNNSHHQAWVRVSSLLPLTSYDVYCSATSTLGTTSSYSAALLSKTTFSTGCCKAASLSLKNVAVAHGSSQQNFIKLTLEALPSSSVVFSVNFLNITDNTTAASGTVWPATRTVTSQDTSLVSFFSLAPTLSVSTYAVTLNVSGESASEYYGSSATSGSSLMLNVYATTSEPPTPQLTSAQFSSDGSYLTIQFDSVTNRGGRASAIFACSLLFNFSCAASAECQWVDDLSVDAVLDSSVAEAGGCVQPGHMLSLQYNASTADVRAKCNLDSSTDLCSGARNWSVADPAVQVAVQGALNPVLPVVHLLAPDYIGTCVDLSVDISRSIGSGGRKWSSYEFVVTNGNTDAGNQSETDIMDWLNADTNDLFHPIVVPYDLIESNTYYNIHVTLCNFLGGCGSTSASVTVTGKFIPLVTIAADASGTVTKATSIRIKSNALLSNCEGITTSSGFTYTWATDVAGVRDFDIVTLSKDSSIYKLDPFTLQVGKTYTVVLTVQVPSTLASASKKIDITVVPGTITAVILGGASQSVTVGDTITLDGSTSFDADVASLTGAAAGLNFSWGDTLVAPYFRDDCATAFTFSDRHEEKLAVTARTNASTDIECEITLTISADNEISVGGSGALRTATATMTLHVLTLGAPLIGIYLGGTTSSSSKVNPHEVLLLRASVHIPAMYSGELKWTADEESGYDLAVGAQAPINGTMTSTVTLTTITTVYMSLRANTLVAGTTVTFSMTLTDATGVSSGSMSVLVNAPPYGGAFSMYPANGTEVVDIFTYVASKWSDSADLPIAYQFGYIALNGQPVIQVSQNLLTYGTSALPAGASEDEYAVTGRAEVSDSLGAFVESSYTVYVWEVSDFNLNDYVNESQSNFGASSDAIRQQTTLATSLLNRVTCDGAPANCSGLYNRKSCQLTVDTCGACLSEDYIGDLGDKNSLCVAKSTVRGASGTGNNDYQSACLEGVLNQSPPATCASAADCPTGCIWQSCVAGQCVLETKSCVANCSGVGTCRFVKSSTQQRVDACYNGDSSCEATCDCEDGYAGSSCAYTNEEIAERQALRGMLVESVADLVSGEDASAASVSSWFGTLLECTNKPDELSFDVSTRVLSLSFDFLQSAIDVNVQPNAASQVLDILGDVTAASAYEITNSAARRRRSLLAGEALTGRDWSAPVVPFGRRDFGQLIRAAHHVATTGAERRRRRRRREGEGGEGGNGIIGSNTDGNHSLSTSVAMTQKEGAKRSAASTSSLAWGRVLSESAVTNNVQETMDVINRYGAFVSANMQPGQDALQSVRDYYRLNVEVVSTELLSQAAALQGQISNVVTVDIPQTQLEEGTQQSGVTLPVAGGATGALMVLTATSLSSIIYGEQNYSFLASPLTVTASPPPPCTSNLTASGYVTSDCYVEVVIQQSDVDNLVVEPVESETIQCFKNDYFSYVYTCSSGEELVVACNGTSGYMDYNCSRTKEEAVCGSLRSNGLVTGPSSEDCQVLGSTSTNITCACLLVAEPAGGWEPTFVPTYAPTHSVNNDETVSVSVVSIIASTTETFAETFESAKDLSLRSIERNWIVISTLSALGLFGLFAALWGEYNDKVDRAQLKKNIEELGIARFGQARTLVRDGQRNRGAVVIKSEATNVRKKLGPPSTGPYSEQEGTAATESIHADTDKAEDTVKVRLETSLPRFLMTSKEHGTKLFSEYLSKHKWINILFMFNEHSPRSLRIMMIYSDMIIMLFVNTLLYSVTDPDDGSCEPLENKNDCLAEASVLNSAASKCQWTGAEGEYYSVHGFCEFREPDEDIINIVYIAFIAAVITIPLTMLVRLVINKVLAVPIKDRYDEDMSATELQRSEQVLLQRDGHTVEPVKVKPSQVSEAAAMHEVNYLQREVAAYRSRLVGEDLRAFDALWGVDPTTGMFKTSARRSTCSNLLAKIPGFSSLNGMGDDRLAGYIQQLSLLRERTKEEILSFKLFNYDDFEVGKRIMFLFLCDMLPQLQSAILLVKGSSEFVHPWRVHRFHKWLAWAFITLIVTGMLLYMILFAISRGKSYQRAWLLSFVIWIVTDFLFVSTLTTTFRDVLVPATIADDVQNAQHRTLSFFHNEAQRMRSDPVYRKKLSVLLADKAAKAAAERGEESRSMVENTKTGQFELAPTSLSNGHHPNGNDTNGGAVQELNAANYFFLSCRVAKHYPHLKESRLVLLYNSLFPQLLSTGGGEHTSTCVRLQQSNWGATQEVQPGNENTGTNGPSSGAGVGGLTASPPSLGRKLVAFVQIFILIFLFYLLMIPEPGLDSVFEVILSVVMAWCLLAAVYLWRIHPVLAFLVPAVVGVSVWMLVKARNHAKEMSRPGEGSKVVPVPVALGTSVEEDELAKKLSAAERSGPDPAGEEEDMELLAFTQLFTESVETGAQELMGAPSPSRGPNAMEQQQHETLLRQLPEHLRLPPERASAIFSKDLASDWGKPQESGGGIPTVHGGITSGRLDAASSGSGAQGHFQPHNSLAGSAKPGVRSALRGSERFPVLTSLPPIQHSQREPAMSIRSPSRKPIPATELSRLKFDEEEDGKSGDILHSSASSTTANGNKKDTTPSDATPTATEEEQKGAMHTSTAGSTTQWARQALAERQPQISMPDTDLYNELLVTPSPSHIMTRLDRHTSYMKKAPSVLSPTAPFSSSSAAAAATIDPMRTEDAALGANSEPTQTHVGAEVGTDTAANPASDAVVSEAAPLVSQPQASAAVLSPVPQVGSAQSSMQGAARSPAPLNRQGSSSVQQAMSIGPMASPTRAAARRTMAPAHTSMPEQGQGQGPSENTQEK